MARKAVHTNAVIYFPQYPKTHSIRHASHNAEQVSRDGVEDGEVVDFVCSRLIR